MRGNEIRAKFLDYFAAHGHEVIRSSTLVPAKDPTLLFTNAGMVQFKDVFLGEDRRPYTRATTSQKCVRAGGKHNDLENVGRTARHHTFFEMLGNFSFGDYFKSDAIAYAWEFLTKTMGLPKDRLWATVFRDDDEAAALWPKIAGLPAGRVIRLGEKDNFWQMGDTGPCGPCSEILVDQGPSVGCGRPDCAVGCDCDRYLEIWNLVFMQFNRDAAGALTPLPRPSIDTGMGLERLAAVAQGKQSNFDTDLFAPLLVFIARATRKSYGADPKNDVSMRVIADHLRAITFLIGDGVLPANEGRGYVLRRIMRRAARHGKMLGLAEPFLHQGVDVVVEAMQGAYPELPTHLEFVRRVTKVEEERFTHTLELGLGLLQELMEQARKAGAKSLGGDDLFRLYDTYGFPLDLAGEIAGEQGLGLDHEAFEAAMRAQRERARASWVGSGETAAGSWPKLLGGLPETVFTGYEQLEGESKVVAIFRNEERVKSAAAGEEIEVLLERTPFYAESGGQAGDRGELRSERGLVLVAETKKHWKGYILHRGRLAEGVLGEGAVVGAAVDADRRRRVARNHTATHLLQAALRKALGDHVKQAGSHVEADRLRFDFTHFTGVTAAELATIEEEVNAVVWADHPVHKEEKSLEQAVASGAMAIFGEKYGDRVRVISVPGVSSELCGGTHVGRSGEIGFFKILGEGSVASGVRRIEAATAEGAYRAVLEEERELTATAAALKVGPREVSRRADRLAEQVRSLEKEVAEIKAKLARGAGGDPTEKARQINGVKVLAARMDGLDMDTLRATVDHFKDKLQSGIVLLASVVDGKVAFACGVTKDLVGKHRAGDLVKRVAAVCGGSGGGKPEMATAGGKDVEKVDAALEELLTMLERGNGGTK